MALPTDNSHLLTNLNSTNLAKENNRLYQVLKSLIDNQGAVTSAVVSIQSTPVTPTPPSSGVTAVTGTPPIASSGGTTPDISLNDTAVTPATYGDSTHVGQFTVDQQGRLTFAANVAITYPVDTDVDYVLMSDGSTPPNAMNNGADSFLYIGYLP